MNKKHGFTLSELLMSIAIIAVVSAMGITIAKRNTDDAYKTYFAVGTMNLNNALAQIETGNVNVRPNAAGTALEPRMFDTDGDGVDDFIPGNPDNDIFSNTPFAPNEGQVNGNDSRGPQWITNNLKYLFGDTTPKNNNDACTPNGDCVINAPNGITYEIYRIIVPNNLTNRSILISMTVPAPRKRVNGIITDRARTDFYYKHDAMMDSAGALEFLGFGNQHLLIPLDRDENQALINNNANLPDHDSIQNRQDLLTAYIDDGTVGRHVPVRDNNGNIIIDFMPIQYGTYRDAFCTILRHNPTIFNGRQILQYEGVNPYRVLDCSRAQFTDLAFAGNNNMTENFRLVNCSQCNVGGVIRTGVCQRQQCTGNELGTAPSAGVIKFASPRKLK